MSNNDDPCVSSSYASYLESKKSVDDRSLNRHVVDILRHELKHRDQIKIVELGAGIGTMVARLIDWSIIRRANYKLLDSNQHSLGAAARWLTQWAERSGKNVTQQGGGLCLSDAASETDVAVELLHSSLEDFLSQQSATQAEQVDLLIANAFLDLVDVPTVMPNLLALLTLDGLFWFSINFDGESLFLPEHPSDDALLTVYHRSMDERVHAGRVAGASRTGRHLFEHLRSAGATILGAGSSDWVVHATDGRYPDREDQFIEHILSTIEAELKWRKEVDQRALSEWLRIRRTQLSSGILVYVAHQLDFVGRRAK
ncbi:MAG TPA: hypothetical protein VFN67_05500 [Polyangiales bacterium]|nr:hypothetical protein [Polyangiales bacterium]